MAEDKSKTIFFIFNTIIAIVAICSSATVGILNTYKQNDFWKEQYFIQQKQESIDLKKEKLEAVTDAFNQYLESSSNYNSSLDQYAFKFGFKVVYVTGFTTEDEHFSKLFETIEQYKLKVTNCKYKLFTQLKTTKPLFSENVYKKAIQFEDTIINHKISVPKSTLEEVSQRYRQMHSELMKSSNSASLLFSESSTAILLDFYDYAINNTGVSENGRDVLITSASELITEMQNEIQEEIKGINRFSNSL